MASFRLKLLGGATLEAADKPVRGRASHRRRLALLAVLAGARGRAVRRDKLIGLIWPESGNDSARHLLSESLYVLRKELGEGAFVVSGDEIALDASVVCSDLSDFEQALAGSDPLRAVELYGGPLLEGFYISDAAEFERWVDVERDRVARAYAEALETLAVGAEGAGDFLAAAAWWRRRSEHDPFSSRVVLRLMRALENGGEHLDAMRAATEHTDLLHDELGASPDPLIPVYAEQLRTAPSSGRMPPPPSPAPATAPWTSGSADPGEREWLSPVHAVGETLPTSSPPGSAASPMPGTPRGTRRGRAAALGAALLLVAGIVGLTTTMAGNAVNPAQALDPRRIAVLYLDDHSPNHTLGFLSAMITEGMIDELGQVPSLTVTSRNGVKPFRDASVPADSIVRSLKVGSLVEGSVERSGRRIRVTVRLIDAGSGRVQSHTMEQPIGDSITLADGMARELSLFLRRRLGPEVRLRQRFEGSRSPQARALLLHAERLRAEADRTAAASALDHHFAVVRLWKADSLLQAASRADPEWVQPWLLRGWVSLALRDRVPASEQPARFLTALECADRALRLTGQGPEALELAGTVRWRMQQLGPPPTGVDADTLVERAQHDLESAVSGDASLARAWATLSQVLRVRGRFNDADAAARRAWEEDEYLEDAPTILDRLYRSSLTLARFDTAAAWCTRGRERYPNDWRFVECRLNLLGYDGPERPDTALALRLLHELEQMDPPEEALRESRKYTPLFRRMAVARVMVRAGAERRADAMVRKVRRQSAGDPETSLSEAYDEAYVRLLQGERGAAIGLLERYVGRSEERRAYVSRDLKFRSLHDDARFRKLLEAGIGLSSTAR